MKKKLIKVLIIILMIVLLFPIKNHLKDGGTVEYHAILYKVSKVKRLVKKEDEYSKKYYQGIIIEIFGFEVYNSVK